MYYQSHQQKNDMGLKLALIFSFVLVISGCAGTDVNEQSVETDHVEVIPEAANEEINEVDPYEHINRRVFVFNNKLDKYVAKPISDAYLWATPQLVQTGIANFFNNLKDINVVLNDAMQGKLQQSAEDTGRFIVNSTVGLGGVFDVASEIGLEKHDEDFAQTLAVWGVPDGPYLVLPVIGPATTRGVPGSIFDTAANPTSYVGLPVQLLFMLNARANAEGALNFIDEAALDPYIFTRESFLQYRRHLISDGNTEITEDTLDLEDEFYDDEEDLTEEDLLSDTESEDSVDGGKKTETEDETKLAENGFRLQLEADTKDFAQASGSFDNALKSFEDASRAYQEASEKLNKLEGQ